MGHQALTHNVTLMRQAIKGRGLEDRLRKGRNNAGIPGRRELMQVVLEDSGGGTEAMFPKSHNPVFCLVPDFYYYPV
jgi:hypothetical protein